MERGGLNPFLTEEPVDAIRFGRVQNVPWIASVTTAEGNYPMAGNLFVNIYFLNSNL